MLINDQNMPLSDLANCIRDGLYVEYCRECTILSIPQGSLEEFCNSVTQLDYDDDWYEHPTFIVDCCFRQRSGVTIFLGVDFKNTDTPSDIRDILLSKFPNAELHPRWNV